MPSLKEEPTTLILLVETKFNLQAWEDVIKKGFSSFNFWWGHLYRYGDNCKGTMYYFSPESWFQFTMHQKGVYLFFCEFLIVIRQPWAHVFCILCLKSKLVIRTLHQSVWLEGIILLFAVTLIQTESETESLKLSSISYRL